MVQEQDKKPTEGVFDEAYNQNIRENIKRFRQKAGMTQAELAAKVGYADKSMIAKIESGKTEPPFDKLKKFAEVFQISFFDLYFSEEELREMKEDEELSRTIARKESSRDLLQNPVIVPLLNDELGDTEFLYVKANIKQYIAAPDWVTCTFAVTSPDNSMLYAGIQKGSTVFIEETEPENGELAAVVIGDDNKVHIRRIYAENMYSCDALIMLQTAHPDFPPDVYYEGGVDNVWILGKAVYVLNELR